MGAFKQQGGMVQKPLPPIVMQPIVEGVPGIGTLAIAPTCWAAALSSWLKAARDEDWSIGQLVNRFKPYLDGSALKLSHFNDIAESFLVRMDYETLRGSELTWEYLYDKLTYSYVYTMLINSQMGHAMVIHAITLDSTGTQDIHVMDPKEGVRVGALSAFQNRSSTFVVGWAKEGTRFMLS
jgi:hypothetical protein